MAVKAGQISPTYGSIVVLFDRSSLEHHTSGIGALTRLIGRSPAIGTGKAHDIALALRDGIG